ncbi:MAG: putative RDD family membrane protein YckC [Vicingaceae bacterium]|jgi:uncharacterized RDD family membrane protein YckC
MYDEYSTPGNTSLIILTFLPIILYYPLLEYFLNGRTLGKALLKIRVTNMEGKPASLTEIVLRWLLRMIDIKIGFIIFIFSALVETVTTSSDFLTSMGVFMSLPLPIVGVISILVTPNNQRLGDFAAGTIVVHDKRRVSLNETLLKSKIEDYQPVFKQVLKLRDKDIYIIKNIVEQANKGNHKQVVPLAEKAKKILDVETDMLPLVFLKTLLNDYNHLAQEKDFGG